MKQIFLAILILNLAGCVADTSDSSNHEKTVDKSTNPKQLNITILLDLSDRINPKLHPTQPTHSQRDVAIVRHFADYFVKDMEKRGSFMAKGKLKVIFNPQPQDPNVNIYAQKLSTDLSTLKTAEKKAVHDELPGLFNDNINKIYNTTIKDSKWHGSDIWRFFKNDVKDLTIESDPSYRNILVIVTDGYLYHRDSKSQNGSRFSYILPDNIAKSNLRNNQNWEKELVKRDFGLIVSRNDLQDLEVLVLEVTPSEGFKDDEDIIKGILSKWFKEMRVKRFAIFNSDLPQYTKERINDFIK